MTQSSPVCVQCKRYLGDCFEVTRYSATRENKGSVRVCSLLCLINWAYFYGTQRVAAGIQGAKEVFDRIGTALRGPKA